MNSESTKLNKQLWKFKVDVGGTFTDYLVSSGDGITHTGKILSNGCLRSNAKFVSENTFQDNSLSHYKDNFFNDFKVRIYKDGLPYESSVHKFEKGSFEIDGVLEGSHDFQYEIFTGEEAPVLVARLETETAIDEDFPAIDLNLGTTRGTNALLERKGAKVGLICNKGFKDVWDIGNQTRSDLFALNIKKPDSLISSIFEISGRLDKNGHEIEILSESEVLSAVEAFHKAGIQSVAICLINSYINPEHENKVFSLIKNTFPHISISHRITRTIKLLERGDTTLVDAYLSPIIKDYIQSIKDALPHAKIRMMTSAGGLVSPQNFSGKDSLLSGPAGGVNGFSYAAQSAGFKNAIGFDMGGTSTDVKRFGGEFEYHFESVKAGVRVVTPMFAIETVAAGGGSICSFDGQRLLVGPESAGASPGPACYGAGGPLTVTDVNLFCGKIDRQAFPFKLDKEVVRLKLEQIADAVFESTGNRMSIHEVAAGFTKIADYKMAEAIKEISSSKGYSPADHILVAFGGAGPQHACSIAGLLGMNTVLIHPYSGILSAYGIGLTGVQFFEERSVLVGYNKNKTFLQSEIKELKELLLTRFKDEEDSAGIQFDVSLDMRYKGQSNSITVSFENALEEFQKKHLQYFSYIHEDREIEVVNLRIKAFSDEGVSKVNPVVKEAKSSNATYQELWINNKKFNAVLVDRQSLQIGDQLEGPAIIKEGLSTIVVEDGWELKVLDSLDLILSKTSTEKDTKDSSTEKDPVRLELFNNLFTSIASRMGETLRRISLSVNIKERLDFSCAVLNAKGDLIVNAPHIPVHLGAVSDSVKALLREVENIEPGTVFLTNDPAAGGSHLPDLTVISPVFDDEKHLLFFTASRAHHAEIGGLKPGSFCPFAKTLEEEGVIFRNFLLADKSGFKEKELYQHLSGARYPSRNPEENIADLKAALAAGKYGENELLAVIKQFGKEVVLSYMDYMCETAAGKTRDLIREMDFSEGSYTDSFDDGTPLTVKIQKSADRLKMDFTGTGPVNAQTMNANRSIVKSAVLYVMRCLLNEDIPLNEGVLENIDIVIPESLLNPPDTEPRAAVSAGNVEVSQKICDVLFAALEVSASSQGTMNNIIFGNKNFGFYETLGGGAGAAQEYNGASGVHTNMTNTRLTDVEIIEKNFPVRIESFGFRKNSGGKGLNSGGDGLVRKYLFLDDLELSLVTQRRVKGPFGLLGGKQGAKGANVLHRSEDGSIEELGSLSHKSVFKGDLLEILTPGGGGWGEIPS